MTTTLAIDPGPLESAYCIVTDADLRPLEVDKLVNGKLIDRLANLPYGYIMGGGEAWHLVQQVAIEQVASYGMIVGAEVFETCFWSGRFYQMLAEQGYEPDMIRRQPVRLHHCHSSKANDGNVRQALIDRFTPGAPNHGKGSTSQPGWFYGFRADIWQAYALAVYAVDTRKDAA